MLRRKPTALAISPEDVQAFEDLTSRRIAYAHFKKTGEDPNGWFTGPDTAEAIRYHTNSDQYQRGTAYSKNGTGTIDPNDELKPLPGDKARIVRSREERIIGTNAGNATRNSGR